jgi:thioredoxin reductase (NADPH)
MQQRVIEHPKVKVLYNTSIKEIRGEGVVTEVTLLNTADKSEKVQPIDGVFIAVGHIPMSQIFVGQIQLDAHGFVLTRQSLSPEGVAMAQAALTPEGKVAYPTMTSVEGVFAGGDIVDTRYWQAITAAGQGSAAAIDAERWLEGR